MRLPITVLSVFAIGLALAQAPTPDLHLRGDRFKPLTYDKLTPEQTASWKKAAEPLVKTWGDAVKKTGVDPDVAMTELKASLTKYNALAQ